MRVELRDVTRTFRVVQRADGGGRARRREVVRVEALKGISFDIPAHTSVGYIGLNGAGKSTTLKIVSGVLAPSSGTVRVDGHDPMRDRKLVARRLAFMAPNKGQLWWDLPVRDTFELARHLYEIPLARYRERVDRLVELLGFEQYLATPVRHLSTGNRTRAELAAALLPDPELIVLDEPTTGLDLFAKEGVHEFVREIREQHGTTLILASHDLRDVEVLCERLLLIDSGQVIFDGTVEALRERSGAPRRLFVEVISATTPLSLPPGVEPVDETGLVREFAFDAAQVPIASVVRVIESPGVADVRIEAPSLPDLIRTLYADVRR